MRSTRLLRALATTSATLALVTLSMTGSARAQLNGLENARENAPRDAWGSLLGTDRQDAADPNEATDTTSAAWPDDTPLDLSTPDVDAGKPKSVSAWQGAPPALQSKFGIDYRKPTIPGTVFQPEQLVAGAIPDQSAGVAWANVNAPGLDVPLGWDKTVLETRLDPDQDQGKFGTTFSRSVPVGSAVSVTLQNGVAVTRTLPNATQSSSQIWASSQALQFNLLPSDTSLSVGGEYSTSDERWLPTVSAEQKLFGGPFSLSGSLSGTANGETNKSVKAGFKRTW